MNETRKAEIRAHIEAQSDEETRLAVVRVFEQAHGADHPETVYAREVATGAAVPTSAELEADAGKAAPAGRGGKKSG